MKRRTKHLVFLALCGAFLVYKWGNRAPSEAQMVAHFHKNRADFERLQKTIGTRFDKASISDNWFHTSVYNWQKGEYEDFEEAAISPAIVKETRLLMNKLNISRFYRNRAISRFYIFGGGFTDTSWSIGYAYSKTTPKNVVKSAYHAPLVRDTIQYSRIDGNWYIYHLR